MGSLTTAAAIALLLYGQTEGSVPLIIAANLAFAISPALYWTAARQFSRRDAIFALIPAGALLLALWSTIPTIRLSPSEQMAFGLAINAAYFYAAAIELWTGRAERLFARWPLVILLAVHATLFAAGSIEALAESFPAMQLVPLESWFGLIHFESIVFSVGTAVFVVAFIRERGEARQRTAAETDPLTGVSTRRALLEQAEEALRECQATDAPLSLVVFDLDRFKSINDRFGHPVGDAVLMRFGDTVRTALRDGDHLGRLGGEEFALLLPGMSLGAAFAVAERVRAGFEADCKSVAGNEIGGTVSAGVATAHPEFDRAVDADRGRRRPLRGQGKADGTGSSGLRPRSAATANPSSTGSLEVEPCAQRFSISIASAWRPRANSGASAALTMRCASILVLPANTSEAILTRKWVSPSGRWPT